MNELISSIAATPPWERLPALISAIDAGAAVGEDSLQSILPLLPSAHRDVMSRGAMGEHITPGCVPPPAAMRYLGPVGHLLGMPERARARDILQYLPDYEDHLMNAPELLLLVPREQRSDIEGALKQNRPLAKQAAGKDEWVDGKGVSWPYTSQTAISKEQLIKLLDGLPSIYLDEASRLEVLQAAPTVSLSYEGSGGSRRDLVAELFQPWNPKWVPHAFQDGTSLRLWSDGSLTSIPFSSVRHASIKIGGRSTDVMFEGCRRSTPGTQKAAPAQPPVGKPGRSSRISTSAIYKALADGRSTARVEVGESGDSRYIFARSFPSGTEDSLGKPHTFGEHPDSDVVVLWDVSKSSLVSIPADSIVSVSYTSDTEGAPLQMENIQEGDTMSNKNLADIEYLKDYLGDMGKLQAKVSGRILGVADLETVGLLGKNYEDAEDKSHGQILQVAGVKMLGGMASLRDTGDTLNLKARLSPHNQKILHGEVKEGFDNKLVDPDSHSDVLSHNLAYVHREHMSFEDTDIFGLPLSTRYMTKRGKPGAKEHKRPKRLSEADYSEMMKTEAGLPTEEDILAGVVGWLTGTGGYHGKVDMLCGHNFYSFDRNYLEARLKRHGMPPLPNIPYLDTLHLAGIMFLPALSALAFIPSVAPETGEEIVPKEVKDHAKELVGALKTGLNLSSLAKALGVPLSDDAHDALADTVATAKVLESMLQWLEDKHQYLLKHAHYDRLRRGAWENYAKGFRNKFKKRKA